MPASWRAWRKSFKIGCIAPKLRTFEGLTVMQANNERGVNIIEKSVKPITDENGGVINKFRPFPTI